MTERDARPLTGSVHREVLPNGMTILVDPVPAAPAVAIVMHVRAGFLDEPDEWMGISHVLEHMFFKGTARMPPGEIARATKASGGYLNAHTSYDHTAYFVVVPPPRFAAALATQAEALRHAALAQDELAKELQVIIEEARRKLDSPGAVAQETLHEVLFDHHRIRRWRIGTAEQLSTFTATDVRGYYESRYTPASTILCVSGSVDVADAVAEAHRCFGDWPSAPRTVPPGPTEPERRQLAARTLRGDVEQSELVIGWRGVPATHPDAVPLDLAAAVLAAGRGSWLYQALRETGVVSGVGAYHYAADDVGVFAIGAELRPGQLDAAVHGIAADVRRLGDEGPADLDVERARALLRQRFARRLESMDGRALTLAAAEAIADIGFVDAQLRLLERATGADVRRVVRAHLDPLATGAVVYHPDASGSDLTEADLAAAFGADLGPETAAEQTPTEHAGSPHIWVPSRELRGGAPQHRALQGADVIVETKVGAPHVALGFYTARVGFDPPEHAGLAQLAVRSLSRGAAGLSARELAIAFELHGGVLAPSAGADIAGFSVTVSASAAAEAASLLWNAVAEPAFLADEVAAERQLLEEAAAQTRDDMFRYPMQLAHGLRYHDRGYGLPPLGTPATIRAFDAEDVRRWYHAARAGSRPLLVAVGEIDQARLLDELSELAGRLEAVAPAAPRAAPGALPGTGARIEERAKQQTAIATLFDGPRRDSPDRFAAEVWAAIASGLGGRLFERLRDERSLAYTVHASSVQRRSAGAFLTYIATSPDRELEAREQMQAELQRFGADGVTEDERDRAVAYLAGLAQLRRQTASAVASEIVDAFLLGTGLSELSDPGAEFQKVTVDDVHRVAKDAFLAGSFAEGIVRGRGERNNA